jgi:hypothetical protein
VNALDELREGLREAARKDVEVARVRNRRRHRRATGFVILALFGGAAAAGAADLISIGEPVPEKAERAPAYRPDGATNLQIALKARSGGELPYGVVTYTARNGDRCALAGVIRGAQLGLIEGNEFRPYASDRTGACRGADRLVLDRAAVGEHTLVYGRAAPATRTVRVRGTDRRVAVGSGGAFLFVYDKLTPATSIAIIEE